jgi:hypothetical protein
VSKIWSNDARVGCKTPSSLVKLIIFKINLEEELNEFEGSFERKELNEDLFQVSLVKNFVDYSFGHYIF